MWEGNFGTHTGLHIIEGVHLIWCLLNTGFTVLFCNTQTHLFNKSSSNKGYHNYSEDCWFSDCNYHDRF